MGTPISGLIAEILNNFENLTIKHLIDDRFLICYTRCVDDIVSFRSPSLFYRLVRSRCRGFFIFHLMTLQHTSRSVGLLWTRDRPVAEPST
jgi:hypothetical protein